MRLRRRAMGLPGLWRGVLAVRHETARASVVLILVTARALAAWDVSRARARPSDGWKWAFSARQNPPFGISSLSAHCRALAPQTSDASSAAIIRRHVFFVAGTFRCRYSICQVVQRALSLLHHKMH